MKVFHMICDLIYLFLHIQEDIYLNRLVCDVDDIITWLLYSIIIQVQYV